MKKHITFDKKQQGVSLIVGLIILLLLSIVATTSIRNSTMQQKMSGNMRDKSMSFQAAESSLLEGEAWLAAQTVEPTPVTSCSSTPCVLTRDTSTDIGEQTDSWWTTNGEEFSSGTLTGINTNPRYTMEFIRFVADDITLGSTYTPTGKNYYYVSSRGTGGSDNAQTVLQTIYIKRF